MRLLFALAAIPVAFVLAVASMPWMFVSIGYAMIGDRDRAEAVGDRMPLLLWLEWMDRRSTRAARN